MPEQATELPSGHRIGRYLVRRRLGAGGFARVYLAWDPDLEIEVAIKLPKPQLAEEADALERFRREATTAARLRHPNVVTVLTVGKLDESFDGAPIGAPFMVMDYLPESLSARLAANPILPEPEWLRIGEEVARGLAYAHAQGVVHRDVKPDNILFGRHGEAVVTDFGIARAVSERLAPMSRSIVVGTPEYFSPEQARGLPLDGRTDIYALGVTLYRMSTGVLPFHGDDWYTIMRQHVEEPVPSPRDANPAISETADAVIVRCLAKSPEARFQTAAELAGALSDSYSASRGSIAPVGDRATVDMDGAAIAAAPPPGAAVRRARWIGAGVTVSVLGIATVVALALKGPTAAPPRTIDVPPTAAQPAPSVPTTTPADSLPPTVVAPRESVSTPVVTASRASLRVITPAGATVAVDGQSVASGDWTSDSMPVGQHQITAALPSVDGCPTATRASTTYLARGNRRTVRLRPVPCGSIKLTVTPSVTARYMFTGPFRAEGNLPRGDAIILPEGDYTLVIEAPGCARYDAKVSVSAATLALPKSPKLICGG